MRAAFVLIPLALIFIGGGVYAGLGGTIRPSTSSDIELQKGLVAHWKLDGNAKDSTPNENNGTIISGVTPVADRKGAINKAFGFSGTNNIQVPSSNTVNVTQAYTLAAWVKPSSTPTGNTNYNIIAKESYGAFQGYRMYLAGYGGNGRMTCGAANGSARTYLNSNIAVDDINRWYHVACTYEAGVLRSYIDGVLATTNTTAVTSISNNSSPLGIGYYGGGGEYCHCSIDDARLYSRALSSAEVSMLHKQYDVGTKTNASQAGLVGQWQFDGNAKDSTPNGSDGTATSVTSVVDRKGVAGSAYAFAGTASSCVQLPSAPVLNSSVFTFSAWVNPSIVSIHTIIGSGNASNPQLRIEGSGALTLLKQNVVQFPSSTGTVPVNSWSHVAITYSAAGDYVYYINGAPAGSGTNLQTFGFSAYRIGCKTTSEHFSGSIDDVRIYKRVLSASELAEQFKSSGSQINLQTTPTSGIANLNSGLRAYWPLNGNTKDATPYGNNGIASNVTLVADRNGRADSAYRFTPTPASVIAIPTNSTQDLAGDLTVSAWVKPSTWQQDYARIIHKYNGATYINYMLAYDVTATKRMRFIIDVDSGSRKILVSSTAIADTNKWYHLVGVRSGSTMSLYIDGVLEASDGAVTGNNRLAPASDLYIGGGAGNSFNGDIDDVRLYSRAFSAADVAALYGKYY